MNRKKYHVGIPVGVGNWVVFRAVEPSERTHGKIYSAVIGPFYTKRGAELMAIYGKGNPHMVCVADCERLARAEKAGKISFA